jgi:hypothetical protein
MRGLRVTVVALLVLMTGGCGARVEVLGVRFGDECPVVPRPLSSRAVSQDRANVHLIVSNQSFEDPVVGLAVAIDGEVVVDQDLDVCGQHEFASFPLAIEPGWHDLAVTTDAGVTHESRIEVPEPPGGTWLYVSYWVEPDAHVEVEVSSEPMGFA